MANIHDIFHESNYVGYQETTLHNTNENGSIDNVPLAEVATWFDTPEDTKELRTLQKAWQDEINVIKEQEPLIEKYYSKHRGLTTTERKVKAESAKMLYVDFFVDQIQEKLDRVNKVLNLNSPAGTVYKDNAQRTARAKLSPIDALLKFDRAGFAKCVFPNHNEKTGSMKYYKKDNRVHCFGCNQSGDAIDVYMALTGCSFGEAIEHLVRT